MAADDNARLFRFMDLPGELRDEVYKCLLCAFEPPTPFNKDARVNQPMTTRPNFVSHVVDTGILCTNSQVHREAYDVMVKTNTFVQVSCLGSLPSSTMILGLRMPIAAASSSVARFKGYALAVTLSTSEPREEFIPDVRQPVSVMMLGRDIEYFRAVHGFKHVNMRGQASRRSAITFKNKMCADEFEDPECILEALAKKTERGAEKYRNGEWEEAYARWAEAGLDIRRTHGGTSWGRVRSVGGETFLDKLAEMQFRLGIKMIHAGNKAWGSYAECPFPSREEREVYKNMVRSGVTLATESLAAGYWQEGYSWRCPDILRAKLLYRTAVFIRLWEDVVQATNALECLQRALEFASGDAIILEEQQNVAKWALGQ